MSHASSPRRDAGAGAAAGGAAPPDASAAEPFDIAKAQRAAIAAKHAVMREVGLDGAAADVERVAGAAAAARKRGMTAKRAAVDVPAAPARRSSRCVAGRCTGRPRAGRGGERAARSCAARPAAAPRASAR